MSSTFCPDTGQLQRALAGDLLSPEQAEGLARHLETCAECAALLQRLPDEDRLLAAARASAPSRGGPPLTGPLAALLQRLKALPGSTTPAAGDTSGSGGNTPAPDACSAANLDPPQSPDELGRIGPYRVLKVLGAGGMGVVYLAEDSHLKRRVALKVMGPALAANPAARRRFQREAEAMAAVEHDHIVAVYQVGEHRGAPFLAMPLLKGESLEARLKREPRLPLPELLRIGREIAEGLAAAHDKGLIHRDVKPGNLWLEEGRGRVKVLDFGLARPVEGSADLTHGMVVGTPAYMAPEQATAQAVDHRCDLFSLGCVLYRMAAGEPPFRGDTAWEVLHAVTHDEPPLAHTKRPDLPLPLSYFIQRLLRKDRDKRPASATEAIWALTTVAQKLESGTQALPAAPAQPTPPPAARPGGKRRWAKRLIAAVALLTVGGAALYGGAQVLIRIRDKDGRVTQVKTEAPAVVEVGKDKTVIRVERPEAPPKLPEKAPRKGPTATDKPKPPAPAPATQPQPPPPPSPKPQTAPPDPKVAAIDEALRRIKEHRTAVGAGFSYLDALRPEDLPLAKRHAAGRPPELVAVLGDNRLLGKRVSLSPDGSRIAAVGDALIYVWGLPGGDLLQALRWERSTSLDLVCFSPDGKHLAAASFGYVVLWNTQTWAEERRFKGKVEKVECLAFSPDGQRLAFTSSYLKPENAAVVLWDWASEREKRLQGHDHDVHGVCFSPDGRRVASVAGQSFKAGQLIVWDAATGGRVYGKRDYPSDVQKVVYSPDGKLLALGHGYSGATIRLLDADSGKEVRELKGHGYAITDLAFDPKGDRLASAGRDQTVRLWGVKDGRPLETFRDHGDHVNSVCFSPDGGRLYSAGDDYRVRGRDLARGEKLFQGAGHQDRVVNLALSLDGRRLTSAGSGGTVLKWGLTTGEVLRRFQLPAGATIRAFAPGDLLAAGAMGRGTLAVWDAGTGTLLCELKAEGAFAPQFSPDGSRLACRVREGNRTVINVWDLREGRLVRTLSDLDGEPRGYSFLPGGDHLAVVTGKPTAGVLQEWDLTTGKPPRPLIALESRYLVGLSPDGRRVVSSWGRGTRLKVEDVAAVRSAGPGLELKTPERRSGRPVIAFPGGWSPDGRLLAGTAGGRLIVWDTETGAIYREVSLNAPLTRALFAPDGRHLIVAGLTGTIYVLRLAPPPKPGRAAPPARGQGGKGR